MTSAKQCELWPQFSDLKLRRQLQARINQAQKEVQDDLPNTKIKETAKIGYTLNEIIAIDLLQKSKKYNTAANFKIFKDISENKEARSLQGFKNMYKMVQSSSVEDLEKRYHGVTDQASRMRIEQQIKNSTALMKFEPETTLPVQTLSMKKCVKCRGESHNRVCSGRPCKRCVTAKILCTDFVVENIKIFYYAPNIRLKNQRAEEVDCCYQCHHRSRQGHKNYVGDGQLPCSTCKHFFEKYKTTTMCSQPTADGAIIKYCMGTQEDWKENQRRKKKKIAQKIRKKAKEDNSLSDSEELTESSDDTEMEDERDNKISNANMEDISDSSEQSKMKLKAFHHNSAARLAFADQPKGEPHQVVTKSLYDSACFLADLAAGHELKPQMRQQALRQAHALQWEHAMQDEYQSLIKNGTWNVVK